MNGCYGLDECSIKNNLRLVAITFACLIIVSAEVIAIVSKQTSPTTVNLPETTDIPVSKEDATNQQAIDGLNVSHETGTPQTPKPSTAPKQPPASNPFEPRHHPSQIKTTYTTKAYVILLSFILYLYFS